MPPKFNPRLRPSARNSTETTREHESVEASSASAAQEALANNDNEAQDTYGNLEWMHAAESRPDNPTSQSISTPISSAAVGPLSSRRPVQRLKSALPRSSPNPTSNSNAIERPNTRPSGLKFQPKSFIRRSREEREAYEKAEAERKTARQAAEGSSSTKERGGYNGRGRGRGQRGGSAETARWKNERFNISHEASGHLGGSTIPDAATRKSRRGGKSTSETSDPKEQGSASGTSRVKKESARRSEKDKDGDVIMGSSKSKPKRTKVKKEEQGPTYVPSEDELDSDGEKRVNIDDISTINLISSEDEDEDEDEEPILQSRASRGKRRDETPRVPSTSLMPVRIQRQEHVERAVGVNTDASSLTSAELRRRAKKRADAEDSLFLPEYEDADDFSLTKPKLKRKPKDVEFVRNERKWKGVYQDEDTDGGMIKVKDEPKDDGDIVMTGILTGDEVEPTSLADIELTDTPAQRTVEDSHNSLRSQASLEGLEEASEADTLQNVDRLPKIKGYHGLRPIHYSEEEEEDDILAEIAEIMLSKSDVLDGTTSVRPACSTGAPDDDSDLEIDNEDTYFQRGGREEVYLFQLPPFVPSLRDMSKPASKSEDKKKNKAVPLDVPRSSASNTQTTSQVKDEPVIKADPDELAHESALSHAYTSDSFHSSGGHGGTLTVYAKGSMFATWGGMRFEIGKEGTGAKLSQELLVTDFERTVTKVEDESRWEEIVDVGKKGWAMGQTRPGHVCVPELLL